jgi:hypothetical protein
MIDNVPQVVETLIANVTAITKHRIMRPSGLIRKDPDSDALMPDRQVAECLRLMPTNATLRKMMKFDADDLDTLALVSGYLFAKTKGDVSKLISYLSKPNLFNEISLTPDEVAQAVATIRESTEKRGGKSIGVVPPQQAETFSNWTVGFKLHEYVEAMSVDFDAFPFDEEDTK